MGYNVP